jgi:SAM-dependent methyltransferase
LEEEVGRGLRSAPPADAEARRRPPPSAMPDALLKITGDTVRDDFNAINTVLHYTRAAHFIGLWKSELALIDRYFPDKTASLLEAGCGAGRVAVGLWHQGYRHLVAFDFASELVEQAINLAQEHGIDGITFLQADATDPTLCNVLRYKFDGVLFLFNGLMQIPGRENRRKAMRELHRSCRPGAHFIFTTHDREDPADLKEWAKEAERWARGEQNPRLLEFGDRYFTDETGNTFMHLPDRKEVLEDMAATGWTHVHDRTRNELASETPKVRNFSDNCRFWVARKA